jgi:hypothetical protein
MRSVTSNLNFYSTVLIRRPTVDTGTPTQCCRFESGSSLILVGWIRVRIGNADLDPRGQKLHTEEKSEEISSFEVFEGWSLKSWG